MTLVVRPEWPETGSDVCRLLVVAFDPGVHTGWAALRLDFEKLVRVGFAELVLASGAGRDPDLLAWDTGQFVGSDGHIADQMMGLCRGVWEEGVFDLGPSSDVMAVAQEDFILQMLSSDRDLLSPVRVNAVFDYAARPMPVPRRKQLPSDAKRVVTDDRLRYLHLVRAGMTPHEKDAMRHAVLLARKMCEKDFRQRWLAACTWLRETE